MKRLDSYNTIKAVQKHSNSGLAIYGLLVTMLFQNTSLAKDIINEALPKIEDVTESKVFETKIRYTTKVKEAKAKKVSSFEYAPQCTAALDYSKIGDELLKMIGGGAEQWLRKTLATLLMNF